MGEWTSLLHVDGRDDLSSVTALVGAGASVDAGLPVAHALLDEIVRSLVHRRWAADELMRLARVPRTGMRDEHDFIRFETLLLWVGRMFDPRLELFAFLDAFTTPGGLHRRLAHATRRGLTLVTVNFDDLLERAVLEQGGTPLTVDGRHVVRGSATKVPVYKVHGTRMCHSSVGVAVDDGALLATTEVIAATHPGTFLNDAVARTLRSLVDGRTLLVAGYSASDDLDVVPSLADSRPARVVWLDHRVTALRRSGAVPSMRSRTQWRRLLATMGAAGADVSVISGETAKAFNALGLVLPDSTVGDAGARPDWRRSVRSWARIVRAHDPTGLGVAALLFGELGRYDLVERALTESRPSRLPNGRWTAARRTYEQGQTALLRTPTDPGLAYRLGLRARQQARSPADARTAVLSELLLGRAAFVQQRYGAAAEHFAAARDLTSRGDTENVHALAWLGRSQVWAGEPARGLRHLRGAAAAFRARGELEGLLDALEASGVGELALMRLSDAQRALDEAHSVAKALGFVDRRFTTACSMAELRLLTGEHLDAERRVRSALRLSQVAGHDEVADAWAVLAESSLGLGHIRAAARAARRAIATTTSVNRSRTQERLCLLAEAQVRAGAERAARATVGRASTRELGEATALGGAWTAALELALDRGRLVRSGSGPLLPAEIVRLADSVRRLELRGVGAQRLARRVERLRGRTSANRSEAGARSRNGGAVTPNASR